MKQKKTLTLAGIFIAIVVIFASIFFITRPTTEDGMKEYTLEVVQADGSSVTHELKTEDEYLDVPYHRKRVGLNHIAFHAKTRQHVDEITVQLKEKGIVILYSNEHPFAGGENTYAVYFEDPDRIKVELVAPE